MSLRFQVLRFRKRLSYSSFIRKKDFRRTILFLLSFLAFIASFFSIIFFSSFFKVKAIRITGIDDTALKKDIVGLIEPKVLKKSIFLLNISSIIKLAKSNFLGIDEMAIKREFPSSLAVDIKKRIPLAVLGAKNGRFLVDSKGTAFCLVEERLSLPEIHVESELSLGDNVSLSRVKGYIDLLSLLSKEMFAVSSVSVLEGSASAFIDDKVKAVFEVPSNYEEKISLLKRVLQKYKIEGTKPKIIDLRFEKPVVTF